MTTPNQHNPQQSETPETDKAWKDAPPADFGGMSAMADHARSLERQRDELKRKHNECFLKVGELIQKLFKLQSENAELRKDREMLDWMDKNRLEHIYAHFKYHPTLAATQETWRKAITAAMQTEKKG